jgi:hypothetical protein
MSLAQESEIYIDYVNYNDESVPVLHTQGDSFYDFRDLYYHMLRKQCYVPKHVGIVSCCNAPHIEQATLFRQLEQYGIPYVNPAKSIRHEWVNKYKPTLIIEGIDSLPEQYTHVLQLDALDVMLNGDFSLAIPKYEEYKVDVLFGASRNNYPKRLIDKVQFRDWRGNFCYLNAGTSFGPREKMKEFYSIVSKIKIEGNDQEQILVRHAFAENQAWVDFDYRCVMFQTFSRANIEYRNNGTMRVY